MTLAYQILSPFLLALKLSNLSTIRTKAKAEALKV